MYCPRRLLRALRAHACRGGNPFCACASSDTQYTRMRSRARGRNTAVTTAHATLRHSTCRVVWSVCVVALIRRVRPFSVSGVGGLSRRLLSPAWPSWFFGGQKSGLAVMVQRGCTPSYAMLMGGRPVPPTLSLGGKCVFGCQKLR